MDGFCSSDNADSHFSCFSFFMFDIMSSVYIPLKTQCGHSHEIKNTSIMLSITESYISA